MPGMSNVPLTIFVCHGNPSEITGTTGKREHRLSLFADDIVLFLTNL